MHELSIASALFDQVQRHVPPGSIVTSVRLRIGPMQAIEPDSLRMGWEAVCLDQNAKVPELQLEMLKWRLSCPDCGRSWESDELYVACECGCATPNPDSAPELQLLQLLSIEVDAPPATPTGDAKVAEEKR